MCNKLLKRMATNDIMCQNAKGPENMPFIATKIIIRHKAKMILKDIAGSRTLPINQVQRAKIIILASKGRSNQQIATDLGLSPNAVSKWRMRWANNTKFIEAEEQKTFKELEKAIKTFLKDSPRPGHPCEFTEVQILKILEIACRSPSEFGYETSHWSLPQLANIAIKIGRAKSYKSIHIGTNIARILLKKSGATEINRLVCLYPVASFKLAMGFFIICGVSGQRGCVDDRYSKRYHRKSTILWGKLRQYSRNPRLIEKHRQIVLPTE